jgi:DNA-binding HxlR family transcriptional regulator
LVSADGDWSDLAQIQDLVNLLSEHWAVPVLGALAGGPSGYQDLLDVVGEGITELELDSTIARLQGRGLVTATRLAACGEIQATYGLTQAGRALLLGPLSEMGDWYAVHADELRHTPRRPRRRDNNSAGQ